MSLPLLVVMVVVGIAAIVAAVHWTGGSRKAKLADAIEAQARFGADFPAEEVHHIVVTADQETAFLVLAGGRTGVVQAHGRAFLTRIVSPRDVASIARPEERTISVSLRDFTWRGGRFAFATAAAAELIAERLAPRGDLRGGTQ